MIYSDWDTFYSDYVCVNFYVGFLVISEGFVYVSDLLGYYDFDLIY